MIEASERTSLDAALAGALAVLRDADLERRLRPVARVRGAVVRTATGDAVDFSSNDYLGLATDPRLAEAAIRAVNAYGTGSGASRLISGDNPEHEALECDLADFLGVEQTLTFSSGYAANVGTIPALVGQRDVIFADELNHASLIDGCRLSRAEIRLYAHNDLDALAAALAEHRAARRRALIVTDGMFSMDGDTASLRDLVSLARQFGAWTYVDDAHAIGVVGEGARGSVEALGVEREIDVLTGTLGKAFGAAGAFVAGSATLRAYLLNRARSFVFSTGAPAAQAASAREGVRIVRAEPARRVRLVQHVRALRTELASRGVQCAGRGDAHIVPIVIGGAARTAAVGAALAERGFLVGAVRPPTVPRGTSRLRVTLSSEHTAEQIAALAAAIVETLTTVPVS